MAMPTQSLFNIYTKSFLKCTIIKQLSVTYFRSQTGLDHASRRLVCSLSQMDLQLSSISSLELKRKLLLKYISLLLLKNSKLFSWLGRTHSLSKYLLQSREAKMGTGFLKFVCNIKKKTTNLCHLSYWKKNSLPKAPCLRRSRKWSFQNEEFVRPAKHVELG